MTEDLAKSMAKARTLWHDGKYKESAQAMKTVGTHDAPSQAQHNKLLADFSAQNHKDLHKLLVALEDLDQKMQLQGTETESLSDKNASPVLKLNMAVLLVQQNKASAAVKVLEPLFEHVEPMQEHVAVRVCVLLTELYLANSSFAQAAQVLHYLETAYGVMSDSPEDRESLAGQNSDLDIAGDASQSGLDPSEPPRPPSRGAMDPPRPPSRGAADIARPPSRGGEANRLTDNPPPGFGGPPDPFASPSKPDSTGSGVTEEGEIAAVLSRMLDQAGRMDAQAVAQGNRFMEVGGVAVVQVVRILRARLNLALNQLRPARRDIKAILAADPNSPQGISLKAQLELQRQSYRKAARILTISPNAPQAPEGTPSPDRPNQDSKAAASKGASVSRAGLERPSQQDGARRVGMLSNMGCVQHALGKSNTAALCFAQALRAQAQTSGQEQGGSSSQGGGVTPQGGLPHNAHLHITYNAGLQALQLGKYSTALRCFQIAAGGGCDRPQLWLRMADCCMPLLQPHPPTPEAAAEAHAVATAIGTESWQQVVQAHDSSQPASEDHMAAMCQQSIGSAQAAGQIQPRVSDATTPQQLDDSGERDHNGLCSFATQCLHNVIFLCNQSLSPAHNGSSSPQAREEAAHRALDTTDKSAEALLKTSGGLANPSGGLPYPSNGHRGRLGSSREGSAAEAAEQLAMLSLDRSRASSGAMDAAVTAAEAAHRQQLHTIKAAALVNLAYLHLQQQQWQQAVAYSQQLLQVPGVPVEQQLLAHCYAAEALCNLQSPQQAAEQLQTAVALQDASGVQPAANASGDAALVAALHEGKQGEGAFRALQVAVLVNAASMQANQGQLQQAQDYATKAIDLQPNSQQALLALVYIQLCRGNSNAALTLLRQQHVPA